MKENINIRVNPRPNTQKKRRKHRDDEADEQSRHHRHRHKKSRRPSPAPDRPRDDHSSSRVRDAPTTSQPIKGERHDPGYDRAARGPRQGPERAERGSGREHRPNREQRESRAREDRRRVENRRRRAADDPQEEHWGASSGGAAGGEAGDESGEPPKEKESADFGLSGKLAEDTNTFRGVVVKYNEPTEARKPKRRWRLYPFKGDEGLPVLHIHRQSAYLLGRDRRVADIPIDHPSCSKQHAALQFRLVPYEREDGTRGRRIRPYVIDLGSANGTYINNKRVESERYVELMEKDVLKFGYSTREYVVLAENTRTESEHEDASE